MQEKKYIFTEKLKSLKIKFLLRENYLASFVLKYYKLYERYFFYYHYCRSYLNSYL